MKALLVQPAFPVTYWGFQHGLPLAGRKVSLPPLGLLTLAAQLPRDWKLKLVDLNADPLRDVDLLWADAVLVGGMRVQSPSMHEVIERAHALGKRTAAGGPAPTTAPEEFEDADVVFQGEAEGRIDDLVHALQAHARCLLPPREQRPEISELPPPRYDLVRGEDYASMSLQYSRGCPYSCEFCDIIEIFGRKPRTKSPDQMLAEFDALYASGHRGSLFIVDDNFIGHRPAVKQLLPRIAEWQRAHGFPFELYTEASVNLASDEPLMEAMAEAGFGSVFLGIETPSKEALAHAKKTQNLKLDLHDAIDALARHGMEVMGGFIVGFDEDEASCFEQQEAFISTSGVPLAMVGILTALPGTQLWRRLAREGRLRERSTGDQFARPNFETRLEERELLAGYHRLMTSVYSPDAFYDRCEAFLAKAGSKTEVVRRSFGSRDLLTLVRTLWTIGVARPYRLRFWRLLRRTLADAPRSFGWAISHAIMGEHCIRYTREDVLPRIEAALAEIEAEAAAEPGWRDAAPQGVVSAHTV